MAAETLGHDFVFSGLRAMNEPVLNTLRPLEEIEHESEEEDDNNFDESAEPTTDTPSPVGRRKTNYLTEKPSITKTVSMESSSYGMDPNEIRLAGKLIGLSFTGLSLAGCFGCYSTRTFWRLKC